MKENSKSAKKILKTAVILLAVLALAVGAWKARFIFNFSDAKIDMFTKPSAKTASVYGSYSVKVQKAASGVYYVKIKDLICDAAPDDDGAPHYFRVDLTLETADEKTAELLKKGEKELTAALRNTMKYLRLRDRNAERIMDYIKDHAERSAERIAGRGSVRGVYFESFLSQ